MVRSTGVGSLPSTDIVEALKVVSDVHPEFMYLPELPARGPGADMIGRTAALLSDVASDLAVETTPTGWKFSDAPGRHVRRAKSWLFEDLDRLEELIGTADVTVKVQQTGPITLSAMIGLPRGERAIRDQGAVQDIADAHREAMRAFVREVRRRLPHAHLVVQLDEPAMDAAINGTLPTQSGFGRLRAIPASIATELHRRLVDDLRELDVTPWLHSCAPQWPLMLAKTSGYRGISGDFGLLRGQDDDALGVAIEAGLDIAAGVIPTVDSALMNRPTSEAPTVDPIRRRFERLGLLDRLDQVVITPTCGFGRTSWVAARIGMQRTSAAAAALTP